MEKKERKKYERREDVSHGVKKLPLKMDYKRQMELMDSDYKELLIHIYKRIEELTGTLRTVMDFTCGPAMRSIPLSTTGRTDRGYLIDFFMKYDEYGRKMVR